MERKPVLLGVSDIRREAEIPFPHGNRLSAVAARVAMIFGHNFVLRLDLLLQLLQLLDPFLLGGMVMPRFRLKGSRSILEQLLLPAVEDRRLEAVLVT